LTFARDADAKAALQPLKGGRDLAVTVLDRGIEELAKDKDAAGYLGLLRQAQNSLKAAKVEQQGETLRASVAFRIDTRTAALAALEAMRKSREAATRLQTVNNLKQIAIAMHVHNDKVGRLPAQAVYDKNGKPMLSWRVLILPYLDQENLYAKFHLNEPWDSEHNKKLLAQMPKFYASPADESTTRDHTTHFQGFFGKEAFFEGKEGLRLPKDFPDGTSNTLMIVEAAKAVPWTKPEDLPYDANKPLPKLGLAGVKSYFLASMCDGSVRTISRSITEQTLRSAITRNGGEVLGPDF
jgi:hypothetical protein